MKVYRLTVKLSDTRLLYYTVKQYSNNDGRIRFTDQRTGELKNFPEEWVAIETQDVQQWSNQKKENF